MWLNVAPDRTVRMRCPNRSVALKVTLPVGVPDPGALALTVAVNVTACPKTDGLTDVLTVVVVAPC